MNHSKVYTVLGRTIMGLNVANFVTRALFNPTAVDGNLQAFLTNEDDWKSKQPSPQVYFPIYVVSAFFLVCAVILMIRAWKTGSSSNVPGKFQNPLRNLNMIILLVILATTSLQLTMSDHLIPGLLFPRFGLGLGQTVILVTFMLWNCEVRLYCRRKVTARMEQLLGDNTVQPLEGVGGWMGG